MCSSEECWVWLLLFKPPLILKSSFMAIVLVVGASVHVEQLAVVAPSHRVTTLKENVEMFVTFGSLAICMPSVRVLG